MRTLWFWTGLVVLVITQNVENSVWGYVITVEIDTSQLENVGSKQDSKDCNCKDSGSSETGPSGEKSSPGASSDPKKEKALVPIRVKNPLAVEDESFDWVEDAVTPKGTKYKQYS